MAATNALIHILALVVMAGLAWALVLVGRQLETLRRSCLAPAGERERLTVDWPLRFVQKFAKAGAIPFYGDELPMAGKPCRIRARALGQLACQEGIAYFRWHGPAQGAGEQAGAWLEVGVWNHAAAGEPWSSALTAALQVPTRVQPSHAAH